jgi:RES domain-containing protein
VASAVERVSIAGSWWRQTPQGSDPLSLASPPSSGRWQRGETVAAIYLADEEPTAWAEWDRALAEIALPPTHGMPRDLWRWTIAVGDIADL